MTAAWKLIRSVVPTLDDDRPLYQDIEAVAALIADGSLERSVTDAVGSLA